MDFDVNQIVQLDSILDKKEVLSHFFLVQKKKKH